MDLLDLWDRAAEVRRRRIHSFPPRPSGLPARSTAVSPPSAAAPWPAGDAVAMEYRKRAWTRRHFHNGERAGVQEHGAPPDLTPHNRLPRGVLPCVLHGANQHCRVSRHRLRASLVWGDVWRTGCKV